MTDSHSDSQTPFPDSAQLLDRLNLIEQMVAEGRQTTERHGWIFIAWGLCYIVATLWASVGPYRAWSWWVCLAVTLAFVTAGQIRQRRKSAGAVSTKSHTLGSVWTVFSVAIMLYVFAAAISNHIGGVMFLSTICFFLGTVNVTSAAIYRWPMQSIAGLIWWAAGCYAQFTDTNGAGIAFLIATFFSQIVFGIYMMVMERRREQQQGLQHA